MNVFEQCKAAFLLDHNRLLSVSRNSLVFAIVIEGVTRLTTYRLHLKLKHSDAYIGSRIVDYDYEPHALNFGNRLIDRYLLEGTKLTVPGFEYSDEPALPQHRRDTLSEWGFTEISVGSLRAAGRTW